MIKSKLNLTEKYRLQQIEKKKAEFLEDKKNNFQEEISRTPYGQKTKRRQELKMIAKDPEMLERYIKELLRKEKKGAVLGVAGAFPGVAFKFGRGI